MTQSELIIENARVSACYLQALVEASHAIKSIREDMTYDEKVSVKNIVLAGSGLKRDFLGGLDIAPKVTLEECKLRGLKDAEAEMVIAERDHYYKTAMELVD